LTSIIAAVGWNAAAVLRAVGHGQQGDARRHLDL